jgi:CheY-like chemotaxis protein
MKKILVIEDNLEIRENVKELLSLEGYLVVTAENGSTGVETAFREIPDLVICDVSMPVLDGYGVLKQLRESKEMPAVPFVFFTAHAEKKDIQKGLLEGATNYLVKPFTEEQLMNAIASAIG